MAACSCGGVLDWACELHGDPVTVSQQWLDAQTELIHELRAALEWALVEGDYRLWYYATAPLPAILTRPPVGEPATFTAAFLARLEAVETPSQEVAALSAAQAASARRRGKNPFDSADGQTHSYEDGCIPPHKGPS